MAVHFDCLQGDIEAGGYFLGGKPFLYEVDDLHFPFGERIDIWGVFLFVKELFGDDVLYLVADIFITVVDLQDGFDHFLFGGILGDIAAGTHLEHFLGVGRLGMHGYSDDLGAGRDLPDALGCLQAGEGGHIYIHQDDMGTFGLCELDRFLCVAALPYHLEPGVAIQDIAPGLPDQFMVVSN